MGFAAVSCACPGPFAGKERTDMGIGGEGNLLRKVFLPRAPAFLNLSGGRMERFEGVDF